MNAHIYIPMYMDKVATDLLRKYITHIYGTKYTHIVKLDFYF